MNGPAFRRTSTRLLAIAISFLALILTFLLLVRPWYLRWGATDEETRRALPGDGIIPNAAGQGTRAITIDVPVEGVWPWLAQIGQDRAGGVGFANSSRKVRAAAVS